MVKSYTSDVKKQKLSQALELYQSGLTLTEISKKVGCSNAWLSIQFKKLNIKVKKYHEQHGFDEQVICSDYLGGLSLSKVAIKHNIYPNTVRHILQRNGYKMRTFSEAAQLMNEEKSNRTKEFWKKPEMREKYLNARKKLWQNPEYRQKMVDIFNDPEYLKAMGERSAALWEDPDYRKKVTEAQSSEEYRENMSKIMNSPEFKEKMAKIFNSPEFKEKMSEIINSQEYKEKMSASMNTPEYKEKMAKISKKRWADPVYREKMIASCNDQELKERMSKIKNSPEFKEKMAKIYNSPEFKEKMAIANSKMPRVSSIQTILYSILDDLGIKYYREYPDKPADKETVIGPWTFDCVIPREGKPTLLIECQGDYWHSKDKAVRLDQSKATYVTTNLSNQYELKCIWEHEFKCKDRVIELIRYWMGLTKLELVNFEFEDIEIKECPPNDYKLLLSKYHYLANACRGAIMYGAYLGEELVAVCGFSSLVRQNLEKSIGSSKDETRELSRLCIHPRYQKRNFASWFVSRCIKLLPNQYTTIISYTDTTFNHNGTVYKACGFKYDHDVPADYWYVDKDGWVMHKKSLYDHARKMQISENDYADKNGYKKIFGNKKLRFIFKRIIK